MSALETPPALVTARRENGRKRPRGYAPWRPQAKTRLLLDQVAAILDEYADHLPLTVRQVFYRLVGTAGYPRTRSPPFCASAMAMG